MTRTNLFRTFAISACCLCFGVVVLGAYVRLTNAGLGCPDWPACYGHLTPAGAAAADAVGRNGQPINVTEAWHEMTHRYAAGTLTVLIVFLASMAIAWRRERIAPTRLTVGLLLLVVVQAVFGALTVTLELKPLIVTTHLLLGMTTLALLWWLVLSLPMQPRPAPPAGESRRWMLARRLALLGLVVLAAQLFLGGWTSSNYAALACPDVPTCQGSWWPPANFHAAFVLWRDLDVDYQGGILATPARIAIQLTHRLGAVATTLALCAAAAAALRRVRDRWVRLAAWAVFAALALQLTIGISMVQEGFPLWLATAHNAGAALLLLATVALNRALRPRVARPIPA